MVEFSLADDELCCNATDRSRLRQWRIPKRMCLFGPAFARALFPVEALEAGIAYRTPAAPSAGTGTTRRRSDGATVYPNAVRQSITRLIDCGLLRLHRMQNAV
ncbi:MAG TPA: hypothetical protein PLY87_08175 [Planctomycetaceae bacterium]|nr:hypothetical protein [Planctomycetaceae bacterium]